MKNKKIFFLGLVFIFSGIFFLNLEKVNAEATCSAKSICDVGMNCRDKNISGCNDFGWSSVTKLYEREYLFIKVFVPETHKECWDIKTEANFVAGIFIPTTMETEPCCPGESHLTAKGNSDIDWIGKEKVPDWQIKYSSSNKISECSSVCTDAEGNQKMCTDITSGFCWAAISSCESITDPTKLCDCIEGIARSYDQKARDEIQEAIDEKIEGSGVDSSKGSDAVESCGTDLSCVENVLSGISSEAYFTKPSKSSSSSSDALSKSDLDDLANSSSTDGVSNSVSSAGSAASLLGKQQGPAVDVTFSSETGMKDGSKVTATAVPSGFSDASNVEKLYFTWYIKRVGCEKTNNVNGENSKCDLDKNGKIDENDWKIDAAMMRFRENSFDKDSVDYSSKPSGYDEKNSGLDALPVVYDSNNDGDKNSEKWNSSKTWRKSYDNGLENGSNAPNCYIQDPSSGYFYELRKTKQLIDPCKDETNYYRACITNVAENSVVCSDVLNPDCKVKTCQSTNQTEVNYVSSLTKIFNVPFAACAASESSTYNCTTLASDFKDFKTNVGCVDANGKVGIAVCLKKDNTDTRVIDNDGNLLGVIFGAGNAKSEGKICETILRENYFKWTITGQTEPKWLYNFKPGYETFTSVNQKCDVIGNGYINGSKDTDGNTIIKANVNAKPTCSFDKDVNLCKHLFPTYPSGLNLKNEDNSTDAKVGDGRFSFDEKKFWGADPKNNLTNKKQIDEAVVMGLGSDSITWTYNAGDEIGVVVEGLSTTPTEHNDSEYMRMWAFSKGKCEALEDLSKSSSIDESGNIKEGEKSFYIDSENKKGIRATSIDLNDCLKENLIDPKLESESFADLKLNITLSPEDGFINDSTGKSENVIIAKASPENATNLGNLMYYWNIEKSLDGSNAPGDNTKWEDISLNIDSKINHSEFSGIGKDEFSFNLNIPEDIIKNSDGKVGSVFYLRIKARANENIGAESQSSTGSIVMKVYQQKARLVIYPVSANSSGILSLDKGTSQNSKELCVDEEGSCGATKNDIMGATIVSLDPDIKLSGFSWKINGNEISCTSNISEECASGAGNTLFFPVLGNEGESVNIEAKGVLTDKKGVNDSISIGKGFIIVKPAIRIVSANSKNAWAKAKGFYKDIDGNSYPDYSENIFEASSGKKVEFQANFYPSWKESQAEYVWNINGEKYPEFDNVKTIAFNTQGEIGDSYSMELSVSYSPGAISQVNNLRKALLKNWNVSTEDSTETNENANAEIFLVENNNEELSVIDKNFPWAANVMSHFPKQALFLLRIILSAVILLFATGIIFSFMPEGNIKLSENR